MLVIVLDFDGVAYVGDLGVQAYARRIAELLEPHTGAQVIAGMRAFLEGKPAPPGMPPQFDSAEDGYELVHALSDAAGVPDGLRRQAYRQSREDLARSAFALDPQPGLAKWLATIEQPRTVWLVTNAPITGIEEVLAIADLLPLVDRIEPNAAKPLGLITIAEQARQIAGNPCRLLSIGDRWEADLAAVHRAGGRTAHVDRFGRRFGTPTWRSTEFNPLLPALYAWADNPEEDPYAL